jgi:hypothetical protein
MNHGEITKFCSIILLALILSFLTLSIYGSISYGNQVKLESYVMNLLLMKAAWVDTTVTFAYNDATNTFVTTYPHTSIGFNPDSIGSGWYSSLSYATGSISNSVISTDCGWKMGSPLVTVTGYQKLNVATTATKNKILTYYFVHRDIDYNIFDTIIKIIPIALTIYKMVA